MQEHILYEKRRKKRIKRCVLSAAVILAAALLYLLIRPVYLRYVEDDHRATCQKARFVIMDRYKAALAQNMNMPAAQEAGEKQDMERCRAILSEVIQENFGISWSGEETLSGLCRSGGAYTMRLDEETCLPELYCDCEGHGTYTGVY